MTLASDSCFRVPELERTPAPATARVQIQYPRVPQPHPGLVVHPSGNTTRVENESGELGPRLHAQIRTLLHNRGYEVVEDGGAVDAVLTVDYETFGVFWNKGVLYDDGEVLVDTKHNLTAVGASTAAWEWTFHRKSSYGFLYGGLLNWGTPLCGFFCFPAAAAYWLSWYALTYGFFGGSESDQMDRAGNEAIKEYLDELAASLPNPRSSPGPTATPRLRRRSQTRRRATSSPARPRRQRPERASCIIIDAHRTVG